jgi:NADH:ubiquinone oxidoreductase subunit D
MTEGETAAEAQLHARHPSRPQLVRFMRCELSRAEVSAIVRHLLTNCPQCAVVTSRVWGLGDRSKALNVLLKEACRQERSAARRRQGLLEADGL